MDWPKRAYIVKPVVCDYGVFRVYDELSGSRVQREDELIDICNSYRNALLICDILNADYNHQVYGSEEEDKPTKIIERKNVYWRELLLHLFQADNTNTERTSRIYKFMTFLYTELRDLGKLEEYTISYDITYDELERVAIYNSCLFVFDRDFEEMYLRCDLDKEIKDYPVDDTIQEIINKFATRE